MKGPSVLAIVVAHGPSPWLDETLRALAGQTYDDLEVVIAAVGDVDVPEGILGDGTPHRIVDLPAGIGFGQAVNEAVASDPDSTQPYLLVLHDDVAPPPDAVGLLVARAETSADIAAVGPKFVEFDRPEVLQEVGGSIDRFAVRRSGLEPDEVDHGQHDDVDEVLYCSAACLLVRREHFDDVGGLEAGMWPMYEDVDLGWRLRARGWRVVVEPRTRVRHVAAMSRGLRRGVGRPFDAVGIRIHQERGRLRFMLKNYQALTLMLILPQYIAKTLGALVVGLVRREFWRVRILVAAWIQAARDLPQVIDARRRAGEAQVEDRELLHLAARKALMERRYERVAAAEGFFDAVRRAEQRMLAFARDPVAWVGAVAMIVVLITLRGIVFGGTFTLGELRPFPGLAGALENYLARLRPEGFDLVGPGSPGIVILGAIRALVGGRAPLAQKVVLLAPLVVAGFGALRLGSVVGLGDRGRRWFPVLAMVNPVTLVLVRDGHVGPLVVWAASTWLATATIVSPPSDETARDAVRRGARWALGWAVVAALHPPGVVWLGVLGVGIAAARHPDGFTGRRVRLIALGISGAFVLNLPWSLDWLTGRAPLVGRFPGVITTDPGGLSGAVLEGGWPWVVWLVVAVVATYVVGLTRTTVALLTLMGIAWLGGAMDLLYVPTALAATGWCTLALFAFVARRVSDELRLYALGARHVLVIAIAAMVGFAWLGAAFLAMRDGTAARSLPVVLTTEQDVGRVLWIAHSGERLLTWSTAGYTEQMGAFPSTTGDEGRLVARSLRTARAGQTHRLGGLLALADVSHVVALDPEARRGLGLQADLSPQEEQLGALIYRNDSWAGRAMLLADTPDAPLTPGGLADVVRDVRPLDMRVEPSGRITVDVPDDAGGVVYLAAGTRRGWRVGDVRATTAAAGAAAPVAGLEGRVPVSTPTPWWRWLYPVQGVLFGVMVLLWLGAVYLTGPESAAGRSRQVVELRAPVFRKVLAAVPLLALAGSVWLAWVAPRASAQEPFLSAAWYCPGIGTGFTQRLAIVNPAETRVSYLVRPHLAAPPIESGALTGHGRVTIEIDPAAGAVVESYGRRVAVAAEVEREGLADAALCAPSARSSNVFPEGGRGATKARPRLFEAYVLYNPFPDLARASVRFIAPEETIAPPALADIRIEPGGSAVIDPEDQFEPMIDLSAEVTVWQGRALVARRLRTVEQVTWSVPSDPQDGGVLPRASTEGGTTALIAVNPSEARARVSLSLTGEEGTLADQTFELDPRGRVSFDLNDAAPGVRDLVARLSAEPPVVLESLVVPDDRAAVSLMPPLRASSRWVLPMAEQKTLVVVNPSTTNVRVEITRLGPGDPIQPLTVTAGRVATVALPGDRPFGVLVEARGGVVTAAAFGTRGTTPGVPTG